MNILKKLSLLFLFGFVCHLGFTQTKIHGVIIDSMHNNVLRSVSVSVYEKGKKTVEKVTLTDRYGKFVIDDLLPNKLFMLRFTYTGYQSIFRELLLKGGEEKDLGHLNMPFDLNEIEAVEITPPVRMNGDTLEFNADAFQLDTNAVVEDLLRKLPGLVVWGDGAVTYNGRAIPSILVNGKPFFGDGMSIALQNIQKDAVKTVQVYDNRTAEKQREDPEDKKYQMNLILKEGKEKLYFGKIGAGGGTDKRYLGQANFNVSDARQQVTLAYSSNNTNSNLFNVDQLLKNTSFKGVGINADFDADFLRSGILRQHVLGGRYQYDFLGTKEVGKTNLLKIDMSSHWDNTTNSNTSSTQLLNNDSQADNYRTNNSNTANDNKAQSANLSYNNSLHKLFGRSMTSNSRLNLSNSSNENISNSFNDYQYATNRSTNEIENFSANTKQGIDFNTNIILDAKDINRVVLDADEFNYWQKLRYELKIEGNVQSLKNEAYRKGDYVNFEDASLSKHSNREYNDDFGSHRLGLQWTVSDRNNIKLGFYANYYGTSNTNVVYDKKDNIAIENSVLSHVSRYTKTYYEPRAEYNMSLYTRSLYGRGYSNLTLSTTLAGRFLNDNNVSTLDYRNLKLNYITFLPRVGLNYNMSKSNAYYANYSLTYNYDQEYPYLDRLRPIYDDINPAYRNYGSLNALKATGIHALAVQGYYSQIRQYGYNISFNLAYRNYQRGLTDSVVYLDNQQQVYTAQMDKAMEVYTGYLVFSKPYLIGKNQTLNLNVNGNVNWGNKYQYLDSELQEMYNNSQDIGINIYYTLVDKYQIGWKNNVNRYRRYNKLGNTLSNDYTSYAWNSGMSISYALSKRWAFNTNGTLRYNKSGTYKDDVFIWNANTTYRVLKGNNLEFKLAAYDLLRQNKGLYFYNGVTEFTTGYSNILTQYYMLSLSYFPRKFGF